MLFALCLALRAYSLLVFVRVILSWVTQFWSPPAGLTPAIRIVYDLTEPVLSFFRRYIPPVGGLDLSPIIVFLIIGGAAGALGC